MSGTGPEVLYGSNQRTKRVFIPTFYLIQEGHASDVRPATLPSWLKQSILLCYKQADQQFKSQGLVHDYLLGMFGKVFILIGFNSI